MPFFFCLVWCQFLVAVCSACSSIFLLPRRCQVTGRVAAFLYGLAMSLPVHCSCLAQGKDGISSACTGRGSKNSRDPEGGRVLWTMGYTCAERNTGMEVQAVTSGLGKGGHDVYA